MAEYDGVYLFDKENSVYKKGEKTLTYEQSEESERWKVGNDRSGIVLIPGGNNSANDRCISSVYRLYVYSQAATWETFGKNSFDEKISKSNKIGTRW